jgi:hypothetical protein
MLRKGIGIACFVNAPATSIKNLALLIICHDQFRNLHQRGSIFGGLALMKEIETVAAVMSHSNAVFKTTTVLRLLYQDKDYRRADYIFALIKNFSHRHKPLSNLVAALKTC